MLGRRLQLIESAQEPSLDGKSPDVYHAEDVMGNSERPSGAVVAPTLEAEAASRLMACAQIAKELRKAESSGQRSKPEKLAANGG